MQKGVAIYDTAQQVIRTKNTASDKDLQVVQPSDLDGMLRSLPNCTAVLTAGQLATKVFPITSVSGKTGDGRICGV